MRLVTVEKDGIELAAVLTADGKGVLPVKEAGLPYEDMNALIAGLTAEEREKLEKLASADPADRALPLSAVKLLAPIPCPRQDVICLGLNYASHVSEAWKYKKISFQEKKEYPVYFSKRVNRAAADGEVIPAHFDIEDKVDHECELAVIIGKEAKNVAEKDAEQYVFGYTILNDMSARSLQSNHLQWYFGKSLDGFTPMGPWIVTADEIAYPPELPIRSYINGELRQNANTELLLFGISRIISELSAGITLLPGTIIATGTPAGVGIGMDPPTFLKKGDEIRCEIEGIGTLTNVLG